MHIRTLTNDGTGVNQVFHQLAKRAGAGEVLPADMLTSGCTEKGLRALATAAGLSIWRPNRRADGLGDLAWRDDRPGNETLWVVALKMTFEDAKSKQPSYEDLHCVVVLDVTHAGVVVADPHPWRPRVRVIPTAEFLAAWTAAVGPGKPRRACCVARERRDVVDG